MNTGSLIAEIAALVGEPARATILSALLDGRALTATELAYAARVTPQTASTHLAKLTDAGLLSPIRDGRDRRCIPHREERRSATWQRPVVLQQQNAFPGHRAPPCGKVTATAPQRSRWPGN